MNSDSGVVTRMCGGCFTIRWRSDAGVSPVRTAVRMAGSMRPRSAASAAIPESGTSRFLWMSLLSAFSGETYSTCVVSGRLPSSPARTRSSRQIRNAASVLPDPVGAEISTFSPERIAGQARACGSVAEPKCSANQSRTIG